MSGTNCDELIVKLTPEQLTWLQSLNGSSKTNLQNYVDHFSDDPDVYEPGNPDAQTFRSATENLNLALCTEAKLERAAPEPRKSKLREDAEQLLADLQGDGLAGETDQPPLTFSPDEAAVIFDLAQESLSRLENFISQDDHTLMMLGSTNDEINALRAKFKAARGPIERLQQFARHHRTDIADQHD